MKNIQIILNAVLSKNIIEYVLIDKNLHFVSASDGFSQYIDGEPKEGDDVLTYLPELAGSEKEIAKIFVDPFLSFVLESIYKNEYYVNITVEHYDEHMVLVLLHNITDITLSQKKLLQHSNESTLMSNTLKKILDQQNALLFVTNNEEITFTNEKFMQYFDVKKMRDLKRKNLEIYKFLDLNLKSYKELFEKVNSKEEYIQIHNDTFILKATIIESVYKLFTLTKITKLTKEMQVDALTGAYTKNYFNRYVDKIIKNRGEAMLVVLDIDNFKKVNDSYGHQVGDVVLKEFALSIQNNIRADDTFSRWGGEEFLLLLKHTNIDNALKKVERLRLMISELSFSHKERLTASFGLAWIEENDDLHSLLQRADKGLYEAKKNGKNCIVFKDREKL